MKKYYLMVIFAMLTMTSISQVASDDILGEWLSEKKDSRIEIFKQNNTYFGKIVWGTGSQKLDYKTRFLN
jgi:hypothetical protein